MNKFHQVFIKDVENKHEVYRGKDCMKKFCESLKKYAVKIINFKKEKIKLLINAQQESYENNSIKLLYL